MYRISGNTPQKNVGYGELKCGRLEEKELPFTSFPTGVQSIRKAFPETDAHVTLAAFGEQSSLESLQSWNPASEFFLLGIMFGHLCSFKYVL